MTRNNSELKSSLEKAALRGPSLPAWDSIYDFNSKLPSSSSRAANIEELRSGNACAIVTGQQVGLFLGPAFTLYKALSAIHLAKRLTAETGIKCIPVFWLQVEDHDLDEIRNANFLSPTGEILNLSCEAKNSSSNRVSVEYLKLGESVLELEQRLSHDFPTSLSNDFLSELQKFYIPSATYSEAFANCLASLFSEEGLVFVNPRWPGMARAFSTIFRTALEKCEQIENHLVTQTQSLKMHGAEDLVHVRKNSPLFFVHEEKHGSRYRVELEGTSWRAIGGGAHYARGELSEILTNEPERLSSSVLLRPILQDFVLPTAIYIGGHAELSYFRQIEPLWNIFALPRPEVISRAHCIVMEEKQERWLNELGITYVDLQLPQDKLLEKRFQQQSLDSRSPETFRQLGHNLVGTWIADFEKSVKKIDVTLLEPLKKTENQLLSSIDHFTRRYAAAVLRKDEVAIERIAKLKNAFYPQGLPQERYLCASNFLLRSGAKQIKELFANSFAPFSDSMVVLKNP